MHSCQEPAWGTPLVAKVMRKEAWHTQRTDRASGVPLDILEHLPPKPESAYFTALCSHIWLYGGCPPTPSHSLWKTVNLRLQLIKFLGIQIISDPISRSVVSDSLRSHESQHARLPCPSPTPGVHSDSRPSTQWWPSSHLILCRPLLLLPSIPPSIRVFSNESTLCMK